MRQVWRVLVVEDDVQMREFFAASVSRCAELELAASLGTVAETLAWLDDDANTLDVLLTDLGLPDGSGLELIRHAIRLHPRCEALVISMFGDEDNVLASIEAGALGYIHKDSAPDDIAQSILDMRAGASPISPMIARKVLAKYARKRARILRDMHDGVGSHISTAIRQLESGRASQSEVLQTLRDSLDQLKLSVDALNLPAGDIGALLANIRYRLEPRFAALDIHLIWEVAALEPVARLDGAAMRQLQFMLFEALSNVLQHAHARSLRIRAQAMGPASAGVQLQIIDDGVGFDVAAPVKKGLRSMAERASAVGAILRLSSEAGRTVVEITVE